MFPITIYLSNLRLAPIQVTAVGHAATSQSPFIDYYAVDEDFVGDPKTFSEKLILMPPDGMPHVPSARAAPIAPILREAPQPVRIAIASSIMKLNPRFLGALRKVAETCPVPLQFVFMPGFARGVLHAQTRNVIWRYLPHATVHTELPFDRYMAELNSCDLFLNPFPYGNMNSITDTAALGLAGICRTGPSLAEHIDEGMFARLGLPKWLLVGG